MKKYLITVLLQFVSIILCYVVVYYIICKTKPDKDVKNDYITETVAPSNIFAILVDNYSTIELLSCKQINNYDSIAIEADEYQMIVDSINLVVLNLQTQDSLKKYGIDKYHIIKFKVKNKI